MTSQLSRRNFLKTLGTGVLSVGFVQWVGAVPVFAQTSIANSPVTALTRFNIGDFEVTAIQDAVFPLETAILVANADASEVEAVLAANNLPVGPQNITVTVLLVNTGSELILLDAGNGAAGGGKLLPTLELLGVTPDMINAVVISHFHPDHIGGLAADGAAVFPNATVYFPQGEADFMASNPADPQAAGLVEAANAALAAYGDNVQYYAADSEIVPGIMSVGAAGHSPGHSAVLIESGDSKILNIADTAINSVLGLAHPDWHPVFDAIPEMAIETRQRILGNAAAEKLQIFGYHFPFPGVGYVIAEGDGFRFVPAF